MEKQNFRKTLFEIIEKSDGTSRASKAYDVFMLIMIVLSILPLALSKEYEVFTYIEWVATGVFIIDYILRWITADYKLEYKNKALNFVLYPVSMWAIVDMLSILPTFCMLSPGFKVMRATRLLRLLRLLKMFRYGGESSLKGFVFFWEGLKAAKKEMWVSIEVLVVLTFFLAIALHCVEHVAQPDKYVNLWDSIVWSFMSYLGNPGKFSPGDPITLLGRCIWITISIIKIAIFAVPAGLIANGFRAALAKDKKDQETLDNLNRIRDWFNIDCDQRNNAGFWPARFERISRLQSKLHLSYDKIIDAVEKSDSLRIVNFSTAFPDKAESDPLAVELVEVNTDYGYCSARTGGDDEPIDGKKLDSNVLIIGASFAGSNPGINYTGFHMARFGRFNFIANESISIDAPDEENRCFAYAVYDKQMKNYPKLEHYINDIMCMTDADSWVFRVRGVDSETSIQFVTTGIKGDNPFVASETNPVADVVKFKEFYDDLVSTMENAAKSKIVKDITIDCSNASFKSTSILRWLYSHGRRNLVEIRLNREMRYHKGNALLILAEVINRHFETKNRYGLDLLPYVKIPVYRGYDVQRERLSMKAGGCFSLRFEPVDNSENKTYTLGFVTEVPSSLCRQEDNIGKDDVRIANSEFRNELKNEAVSATHAKQWTFNKSGKDAFTIAGRLKSLLKKGMYRCTVSIYSSETVVSFEFNKDKLLVKKPIPAGNLDKVDVDKIELGANKFSAEKLCVNIEEFSFPGLDEFNGRKVMHTDEILYDGLVVDGQVWIADRHAVETKEFYIDSDGNGGCSLLPDYVPEAIETEDNAEKTPD